MCALLVDRMCMLQTILLVYIMYTDMRILIWECLYIHYIVDYFLIGYIYLS